MEGGGRGLELLFFSPLLFNNKLLLNMLMQVG